MPQFYAYIYRDPSRNFQPIYAGKGRGRRAYDHLKNRDKPHKKENKSFMGRLRNMKEAGIEPVIQIFNCESEELAFLFEEEAIDKYGRIDLGMGPLHNHTNGGEGSSGHIDSPETRKKKSDAQKGENHPNYGKSAGLETRAKMSDAQKGENHPQFGKSPSAATRKKQSNAKKGKPSPNKGKPRSLETRAKQSEAMKGKSPPNKGKVQPKSICPHCGTEGGGSAMHRWHFDNCKHKKVLET